MIMLPVQTLYESSIAFGMRKALQTEQGKGDMEGRIGTLEADTKDFERQVLPATPSFKATWPEVLPPNDIGACSDICSLNVETGSHQCTD